MSVRSRPCGRKFERRKRKCKAYLNVGVYTNGDLNASTERREKNERLLETLLESLPVMHTTDVIMRRFGELKSALEGKGSRIDDADVLIAATALTYSCPLVTANVRHFSRFEGLELLDWTN